MSQHDLRHTTQEGSSETFGIFHSQSSLGFDDDSDSNNGSYGNEYDVEEQTLSSSTSIPSLSNFFHGIVYHCQNTIPIFPQSQTMIRPYRYRQKTRCTVNQKFKRYINVGIIALRGTP
jgi:hypothetical protein